MQKKRAKKVNNSAFFLFGGVCICIIFAIFYFKNLTNSKQQICCGEMCFHIEIAQTQKEKERGLMYRESLPENAGMLFIFDEPAYLRFWMKNTLIPLEMIRLDENFNIVDIQEAEPCTTPNQENCPIYTPKSKAQYVLEINQGLMKKSTLQEVVCELQK